MAVKVIVELKARPGERDALKRAIERITAQYGPRLAAAGSLGSTFYEVLGDPDLLVEIADWESAEARDAVMHDQEAAVALAPLMELLGAPFKATILTPRSDA
jgi:hypothetical protein